MIILLKKITAKILFYFFDILIFFKDLLFFKILKKNSFRSYNMMLRFFYLTGGLSNDIINFFVSKKPLEKETCTGIFSKFDEDEILKYKKQLDNNGYLILDNVLNSEEVNALVNDFIKVEGFYTSDSNIKSEKKKLNIQNPESVKFHYNSQDIIDNENFQKLLFDSSLINFAQSYLKSYPIIDNISSWWSFPSSIPDKNAAQWWHFDLERPKWLKFFFFLTDCTLENGAHCFVKGSHKNSGINWSLRKRGYERLSDQDINNFYPKTDIVDIIAKKGSLLIEDTRGLHKGRHLIKDNRFLIQLQYSSSSFGTIIDNFQMPELNKDLLKVKNEFNYTYSLFK
jgi:ectoine hydroxylase-related dioxygenase (phytanoyl-CoA dioxygenase family)